MPWSEVGDVAEAVRDAIATLLANSPVRGAVLPDRAITVRLLGN